MISYLPQFFAHVKEAALNPRERVSVLLWDEKGRVMVSKRPGESYGFPGGGVDEGESVGDAARRETLEEAGLRAGKLEKLIPSQVVPWTRPMWERLGKSKGRGEFNASLTHWRAAPIAAKDDEHYGVEGDGMKVKPVAIATVLEDLERTKKDRSNVFRSFDQGKIDALVALSSRLAKRGQTQA